MDQTLEVDVASEDLGRFGLVPGVVLRVAPTRLVAFPLKDGHAALPVIEERWLMHAAEIGL
jgi:sulfate transport system ATP-binding protein